MNGLRFALAIDSGKIIFYIANQSDLRVWLICFFTERVVKENGILFFEASSGWDSSGEKGIPENPQIFRNPK